MRWAIPKKLCGKQETGKIKVDFSGLLTGSGWQSNETFSLEFRRDGEKILEEITIGDEISFHVGKRICIGYRAPGMDELAPCPDSVEGLNIAQCQGCFKRAMILPCLRCTGERCNNPARRSECVSPYNHALYLASFAPGIIKVGVARWHRRKDRLSEQGARAAIIVARDDGQMIRRHEHQIKKFGTLDRLSTRDKLKYLHEHATTQELVEELESFLKKIKRRMNIDKWLPEHEVVDLPPVDLSEDIFPRLRSFTEGDTIHGTLLNIIGQALILSLDNGEIVAIEPKTMAGIRFIETENKKYTNGQIRLGIA